MIPPTHIDLVQPDAAERKLIAETRHRLDSQHHCGLETDRADDRPDEGTLTAKGIILAALLFVICLFLSWLMFRLILR